MRFKFALLEPSSALWLLLVLMEAAQCTAHAPFALLPNTCYNVTSSSSLLLSCHSKAPSKTNNLAPLFLQAWQSDLNCPDRSQPSITLTVPRTAFLPPFSFNSTQIFPNLSNILYFFLNFSNCSDPCHSSDTSNKSNNNYNNSNSLQTPCSRVHPDESKLSPTVSTSSKSSIAHIPHVPNILDIRDLSNSLQHLQTFRKEFSTRKLLNASSSNTTSNSSKKKKKNEEDKAYVYEICFGLFIAAIILTIYCVCLRFRRMHASFNEMSQGAPDAAGSYKNIGKIAGNAASDYVRLQDGSGQDKALLGAHGAVRSDGNGGMDGSIGGAADGSDGMLSNAEDGMIGLKTGGAISKAEYKLVRKLSKAKFDIKTKLVAHNHSHGTNISEASIPQYHDIKHNMGVRLSTMTDLNEDSHEMSISRSDASVVGIKELRNLNSSQSLNNASRGSVVTSQNSTVSEASWVKYLGGGSNESHTSVT